MAEETHEQYMKNEEHHVNAAEDSGRRKSLTDKAKGVLHEVAEIAKELAEELSGHITEKDVAHAAKKIADLYSKLHEEERQLKELKLAAEVEECAHNLTEYHYLKEKEHKVKAHEQATRREIAEAEIEYKRLEQIHASGKSLAEFKSDYNTLE